MSTDPDDLADFTRRLFGRTDPPPPSHTQAADPTASDDEMRSFVAALFTTTD